VLDSSFNPPTLAHRRLLELADEACSFDARLLLLAKANVDKAVSGAPLLERVRMMELLAAEIPHTCVGVTAHGRFVDKAKALRRLFGEGCKPFFILGYDTLVRLFDPKYYEDMESALQELFGLAEVVFANRSGSGPAEMAGFLDSRPVRPFAEHLHTVELEDSYAAMSSTEARRRIALGLPSARDIVPHAVLRHIHDRSLYRA
jgi:nicotinamide-nucleotide adenylyltransferase